MELDAFRSFLVLAEELHFGRAAERLDMSPSSLSRQIRSLEGAVGTPLLERTSRRVTLTLEGRVLAAGIPAPLAMIEDLLAQVRTCRNANSQQPRQLGTAIR